MSAVFSVTRAAWVGPIPSALKAFALGVLTLWYASLPVTLIDDVEHIWRLHDSPALLLSQAISSCAVASMMPAEWFRRVWIGPTIAATVFVLLDAVGRSRWAGLSWLFDVAPLVISALIWVSCVAGMAAQFRRRVAPVMRRHSQLQAALAGLAALATGLVVLLHPRKLSLLDWPFYLAWGTESMPPADAILGLYYALGGLAAGFTLKLLWPRGQRLFPVAAAMLSGAWCALAAWTLLDREHHRADLYTPSTFQPLLLLAPVAIAVFAGFWLARWPLKWSRDA